MYKIKKQLLLIFSVIFCFPILGSADIPQFFDLPDTGYTSNVVTDMLSHNGGIWFATDEGLNYSLDGGLTWLLYDQYNGLVSSSISAFTSVPSPAGQRIWVATNHEEVFSGVNLGLSDGVSYSDDNGQSWNRIDFETAPNDIPYVWGGDRTIFDITAHYDPNNPLLDNYVFFTAFAGGFLASRDGGATWKRIFPSTADSTQFYALASQPSLRNRYFSCAVDTSHGDSVFTWAGTAGGIFQYIYAEPKDKPYTKNVTALEFCADCGADDSSFVYYGGLEGLSRGNKINGSATSKFVSDGLPGEQITALLDFGGRLFVGTAVDATDNTSTGLAISTTKNDIDSLFTFTAYNDSRFEGTGHRISSFAVLSDRIYMAVEENGLYVSSDTGTTWTHIDVDPSDVTSANRRNVVHALEAIADTLNIGTDSGLVRLYLSPSGTVDSTLQYVFVESQFSSTKIINLKTQSLLNGDQALWTTNVPLDTTLNINSPVVSYSLDGGQTFITPFILNGEARDVDFLGDTAIVIGSFGSRYTAVGAFPSSTFPIYEKYITAIDTLLHDTTFIVLDSLNGESLRSINIKGDTIVVGGDNGFAISTNRGVSFNVVRVNTEEFTADAVTNYNSSIFGIDGDWVPAMEVQYNTSEPYARVWASVRPTYGGLTGISVGWTEPLVSTQTGDTLSFVRLWKRVHDNYAWNFSFASDTVFAATNEGLIFANSDSLIYGSDTYAWTLVEMNDSLGAPLLLEGTPVYAVEVAGNYVWVGTDDRTVRLNRSDLTQATAFYVVDSKTPKDEVYAFPLPFSHVNSASLDFHFNVEKEANITIEIYDFAMHLVKRVVDNKKYAPGIYPTVGSARRIWDGLNGKGVEVAVGMYYFKISYSTGEVYWGKIAVIP